MTAGTAPATAAPLTACDTVESRADGHATVIVARKRVDPAELYLRGHFPGFVIYPGVFLIETFHQAILAGWRERPGVAPRLAELTSVRFLAPLLPGDELLLEARVTPGAGGASLHVRATCHRADGTLAARLSARYDCPEPAHA
ncbi:MAG TPA: hypothetical protein VFR67_15010 [Pilimelia sp.]|nr:hypothetical protein [Pilimelia sp.]